MIGKKTDRLSRDKVTVRIRQACETLLPDEEKGNKSEKVRAERQSVYKKDGRDTMNLSLVPQYELLKQERIEDVRSDGYLLRHKKSGARVLVLQNEDENKVFNIAFRTTPSDSTGVAHILEHSVLCGSRKFPAKDPFVELVKGSLNTFLNAMTYPDKTMYPIASCNEQDFCNLMHVYLDAVFYPNIYNKEEIFRQEGWNYELESTDDEIIYNGVVYNEMKGAFSSPEDVVEREISSTLFPDTTYGVESGGDPVNIPDLSYEQFLEFHRTYYHPSNSYIYLYGNMDAEERLNWMDREYLSHFTQQEVHSEIGLQKPFDRLQYFERTYPVAENDPIEDNAYLTFNAVIGTSLDIELCNAFAVLEYAIVSSPGAKLKQALLDAGIGKDIIGSYDSGSLQPVFTVMAKNANVEDKDRFLSVIRETLERIAEEGVDQKALLAGINTMEFKFREADYGAFPKGLIYGIDIFDSWLYDEMRPFDYLEQIPVYQSLREKVGSGYYEELIRTYLLDNPHESLLVVGPERGKTEREEERVREKLHAYKESLSEEELQALVKKTEALRTFQETPSTQEELEKIPMLSREDIETKASAVTTKERTLEGSTFLFHDVYTNGIAYLHLLFDSTWLSHEDIPYFSMLKSVLGMVDTEHYSYQELNHEINGNTGGISCGISVYPVLQEENGLRTFFGVKARMLYDKIPYAISMIREILFASSFENDRRLYEIVARLKSRLSMQLNSSGHSTAAMRSMAGFSAVSAFNEEISGITYYQFVDDLEQHFEEKKGHLKEKMAELCGKLFCRERLLVSLTMEGSELSQAEQELGSFIRSLPEGSASGTSGADQSGCSGSDKAEVSGSQNEHADGVAAGNHIGRSEAFTTPGQVQYVARTGNFRSRGFEYTGALRILKVIMSYEYLWVNIRVKGGAYGCMSGFGRTGDTYFVSYRDPNLARTNEIYDGIPEYLEQFTVSDRDMTKYIIGTISELDVPMTPATIGSRLLNAWICGITDEMVQKERDEILQADQESIRALAPLVKSVLDQQYFCVIGNEAKIKKDAGLFETIQPFVS
jgi:hypothetical protein